MRLITFITLLFIGLCFPQLTNAKKANDHEEKFNHYMGVGAGLTTGNGLSYRYIPDNFGAQLTFSPYIKENSTIYNLGLTFIYRLIKADITNFYIYQGNRYYYSKTKQYNPDNSVETENIASYFNNGVGIGIEFILLERVSINIMGGYAAFDNFQEIDFTGEAALYYIF